MRSSAARIEQDENIPPIGQKALDAFARDLSNLCRIHGIGITGEPTLFVMEQEDYAHNYGVDPSDRLIFGFGQ
jgi:hypothetical protein